VKVSVDTIVRNSELLDESVKAQITGSVVKFEITDEGVDNGVYWLTARATVEPGKASEALQRNTAIAVYLPMRTIDGNIVEDNPFSEAVVNQLVEKGFDVVDFSKDQAISAQLRKAMAADNMAQVRELVSQYAAGSAVIGELTVIDKGKDVGYTKINFTIVDGSLPYRIVSNGKVVKSGSLAGRGQGANNQQAEVMLASNMAKRESTILASETATKILGANSKTVRIELVSNTDVVKFQKLRDTVKNISWVLSLKEIDGKTMTVDYPEKTMYLATIISQQGYKIKSFSDNEILVYQ
jgi:hypothetical protein